MHSIYLGIQAFISAAGGSTSLSSKDLCSLTEFILWLPAPLLSTLWHPLAPEAFSSARCPGVGQKAGEAEKPCSSGELVSELMRSISFLCSSVHEDLWPPQVSPPALGMLVGRRKDQDFPPQRFFGGHTVSK